MGDREVLNDLAVDLIAHANRDFFQIRQAVQRSHHHLGGALALYAVAGSHTVKPAHTARSAGGSAELALVAAVDPQFLGLVLIQDLRHKFPGANGGGIGLGDHHNILDLVRRQSGADGTVTGQSGGGGNHGINAEIRVLQSAQLALQQNIFTFLHRLLQVGVGVAHIGSDLVSILHAGGKQIVYMQQRFVIHMLQH